MKKRLVKKWINRYISPMIKDLEQVYTHTHYEDERIDEYQMYKRVYKSVAIANGHIVEEGCIIPQSNGLRVDILKTKEILERLMASSHKTFIRVYPRYANKKLYMRVLVE